MRFGKIRIEDGNLIFARHMMLNNLPCKDIIWAYMRREGVEGGRQKQFTTSSLVVITRRRKRYQFDMTDREIQECIQILKALNPEMATGFPRGGRIHLQSLPNTRDLGALMTKDGRHILPRKLLRSGSLYHVSLADQDMLLEDYKLSTVIDFRTEAEREQKPDTIMKGVEYYPIPVLDEETSGITQAGTLMDMLTKFDQVPDEFICKQYENLVRDEICIKQYANFLDVVLHQKKGAVLWHCSAGKDRVGIGTALLLYALGVPRKTIKEDFLKTNVYLDNEMQHMVRYLETRMIVTPEIMDKVRLLYKVKGEYLDTAFRTIEKDYGSVDYFMRKALYMNPKTIEALRNKYLV
nr:tyrosine-protein phosphatase [uncultured Blautia sp.]